MIQNFENVRIEHDAHDETICDERGGRSCDVNSLDNLVNAGRRNASIEDENTDTESEDSASDQLEYVYDSSDETPRYELEQWPRHVRSAEQAWPVEKRDTDIQARFEELHNTIGKFLTPESMVYKSWSRKLSLWRKKASTPTPCCSYLWFAHNDAEVYLGGCRYQHLG